MSKHTDYSFGYTMSTRMATPAARRKENRVLAGTLAVLLVLLMAAIAYPAEAPSVGPIAVHSGNE